MYQDLDPDVLEMFRPGTQIAGRYEILSAVERGKYGQVFQCRDMQNKWRFFAAKICSPAKIDNDNAKVESKLMQKLRDPLKDDNEGHNRILHICDTIVLDKRVILITDFLGISLFEYQKLRYTQSHKQVYSDVQQKLIAQQLF